MLAGPGYQMALPEVAFDVLRDNFGVTHECFASPLNNYLPSFCSAFPDTGECEKMKGRGESWVVSVSDMALVIIRCILWE